MGVDWKRDKAQRVELWRKKAQREANRNKVQGEKRKKGKSEREEGDRQTNKQKVIIPSFGQELSKAWALPLLNAQALNHNHSLHFTDILPPLTSHSGCISPDLDSQLTLNLHIARRHPCPCLPLPLTPIPPWDTPIWARSPGVGHMQSVDLTQLERSRLEQLCKQFLIHPKSQEAVSSNPFIGFKSHREVLHISNQSLWWQQDWWSLFQSSAFWENVGRQRKTGLGPLRSSSSEEELGTRLCDLEQVISQSHQINKTSILIQ